MGEPEQVMAEPDEVKEEVEGLHPPTLQQQNPKVITNTVTAVTSFVAGYGWYAVGFLFLGLIAWYQLEPKIKRWLKKREEDREAAIYHKNPDIMLSRHQALDQARQKLQERYNKSAQENLEKKKITGQGQQVKDKSSASVSANTATATATPQQSSTRAKVKPAAQPRLRPEYNPLTGDTGASSRCRWQPSARGSSGGG